MSNSKDLIESFSSIPTVFYMVFLFFFFIALVSFIFQKEMNEVYSEVEKLNNMSVELSSIKGNKVFLTSHELKKIYYFKLDEYDSKHTKVQETYKLNYTPEGWGRHSISHNGKKYDLYEV